MDLNRMALFAEVAERGSFTAAAAAIGVPKSTLSQHINQLEADLGMRLLMRTTRRVSLTQAGEVYLRHCGRMLESARAAEAAISALRDAPSGRLRITMPEASGILLFPDLLAKFRELHRDIDVDCVVTDAAVNLIEERIDVAFRTGKLADSSFVSRRVGKVTRALVAAPAYLDRMGRPGCVADLLEHQALIHHTLPRWPLLEDGEIREFAPQPGQTSNSLLLLRSLAIKGGGVALLPLFSCQEEIRRGVLERVLPQCPPTPNEYWAITVGRSHQPAAVGAFLHFLDDYGFAARLACQEVGLGG